MEAHYKLITLGSYGVGKTCILMRASEPDFKFPETYLCTIGVDYKVKLHNYDGKQYKLIIWDTAGQERFYSVNKFYFSGCHGVILVYDITNEDSLEKISFYIQDFKQHSDEKCSFVLIGNKKDSKDRKVSYEQGEALAKLNNIPFFECSALTGEGIEDIFDATLKQLIKHEVSLPPPPVFGIKAITKKKKCCF